MVAEQVGFATRPAVITSSKTKNRRHQNIEDEKNKWKPTNNEEIKKRINWNEWYYILVFIIHQSFYFKIAISVGNDKMLG